MSALEVQNALHAAKCRNKPDSKDIITADITAIATTCNNRSPVELTPAGTKVPAWSTVAVTDWM